MTPDERIARIDAELRRSIFDDTHRINFLALSRVVFAAGLQQSVATDAAWDILTGAVAAIVDDMGQWYPSREG